MIFRHSYTAVCLLAIGPLVLPGPAPRTARISLDPGQRFQNIDGFGVNFNGTYFREAQKPMIEMLVRDLGATIFRLDPYGLSDWEQRNDDEDPGHMNLEYYNDRYSTGYFQASWEAARFLNSLGIRPFLTLSGITPDWMNDNNSPVPSHKVCRAPEAIQKQGYTRPYHLNPTMYDEYAEMVVSMLVYARDKAHVDFEYFSPFNETDCFPAEGPRIDPDEAPRVLEAIARHLDKEQLGYVRLVVADQAGTTNNYIGPILRDEAVMKHTAVLSMHSYGEGSNVIAPQLERIRQSKYPNTRVWLTEYGDLNAKDRSFEEEWKKQSMMATRRALRALNEGARAALFWDAFDNLHEHDRAMTYYGLVRNEDHVYSPKKRYYAAKQLYKYVRPGAQRIALSSDTPDLVLSAFRDGQDGSLVVVGVKEGGPDAVRIALPSPQQITWEVYATTPELDCAKIDTVAARSNEFLFHLPEEAVFTLVGHPGGNQ